MAATITHVAVPVEAWGAINAFLGDAPFRVVAPIVKAINNAGGVLNLDAERNIVEPKQPGQDKK